jgi:probable HAF family extracellular repeat protein
MKSTQFATNWPRIARLSLALATLAGPVCIFAQPKNAPQYTVVDLGPVGPSWSQGQPFTVSSNKVVSGEMVLSNRNNPVEWVSQAVLWEGKSAKVISSPGLGGPNSVAYAVNVRKQAVGQSDTQTQDPNGEDFCGAAALGLSYSGNTCVPFLWEDGTMVALARLRSSAGVEGSNGVALQINDFGMIAGTTENGEADSTCPGVSFSPQTIEFKPVVWMRPLRWGQLRLLELPTIGGDPDGIAYAINDLGQVVGASGNCGPFNAIAQNNLMPLHAVLWRDGNVIDLGNLGGDGKFNGIYASGLNDDGQVVGTSDTTGDVSFHGFVWHQGHITDLGTLTGDAYSSALAISNHGMVLGVSINASFSPRAVLWRDGVPTDMNTIVPQNSALYLESACSINDKGEITGFAILKGNPSESHAYLAKPIASSDDGQ